MLLLDNAGFHTRPNLVLPDGIRLVYLPTYSPELQPAETLWPLMDDPPPATPLGFAERSLLQAPPIVNKLVPTLDALVDTIGTRCCDLTERQSEISSRTNFAW